MCTRYYMELSPELRPYIEAAGRSPLYTKMMVKLARGMVTEGEEKPGDIAPVIATSQKGCRKDVIKIDSPIEIDLDVLGYLDPGCTVNVIRDSKVAEKYHPTIPETITGVISCKNPRCITSVENDLPQIFRLTDKESQVYRCIYCETMAKKIKL